MLRDGMYENEAWGRPRDAQRLPPPRGNGFYTQEIYYQILNAGLRLPPSAGSASGVLQNPVGYNRVYVQASRPLTWKKWWDGLRAGRCFTRLLGESVAYAQRREQQRDDQRDDRHYRWDGGTHSYAKHRHCLSLKPRPAGPITGDAPPPCPLPASMESISAVQAEISATACEGTSRSRESPARVRPSRRT